MAFCKHCGGQLPAGANNCPSCGAPVNDGTAPNPANYTQYQYQQSAPGGTTEAFLGKDHTAEYDPADINANKVACGFVYIPIMFWLPFVACPGSPYGKFHANQGLVMLLFCLAVNIASSILGALWAIPAIGTLFGVLGGIISWLGGLCELGLLIYGMVNTFTGKAVELPLIGRITLIK
ncbi:MAG: zinc ribbon domain-containing protein [Ruminiclostridium sp.]|nr:zinc ribbon domain-containing protein [Ruminiclostridium sp.]